jgi:hypothetical protein
MENKIIESKYVKGSGWFYLFSRKEGTVYQADRYDGTDVQHADRYIIQFEGTPDFDSGYDAAEFETLDEALAYWNEDIVE